MGSRRFGLALHAWSRAVNQLEGSTATLDSRLEPVVGCIHLLHSAAAWLCYCAAALVGGWEAGGPRHVSVHHDMPVHAEAMTCEHAVRCRHASSCVGGQCMSERWVRGGWVSGSSATPAASPVRPQALTRAETPEQVTTSHRSQGWRCRPSTPVTCVLGGEEMC